MYREQQLRVYKYYWCVEDLPTAKKRGSISTQFCQRAISTMLEVHLLLTTIVSSKHTANKHCVYGVVLGLFVLRILNPLVFIYHFRYT